MNTIINFPKEKIRIKRFLKIKNPIIKIPKMANSFIKSQTHRENKELPSDNHFIFNKKEDNPSSQEKLKKKKTAHASMKKIENYFEKKLHVNHSVFDQIYNKTPYNILNPRNKLFSYRTKMVFSAKNKINSITDRNIHTPVLKNGFNYSYVDINSTNLINLEKKWDEFEISKQYRNYFKYIYRELEPDYKEELYRKEIEELNNIKKCIYDLKHFINLRTVDLCEIKDLNNKLEQELLNKNNNAKEVILNQISDKIISLREHTISICKTMRKLKYFIFSINNLGKYDLDIISKNFDFDKNYIIKMKSELKFLNEGFAKYYFNIENDQTPFLLKASNKTKKTEGDYFLRMIPLNYEKRMEILDCDYYIHQELIAYQNTNFNKKNFRCISPLKRDEFDYEKYTELNKRFNIKNLGGFETERRKGDINWIGEEIKNKYKDIEVYLQNHQKKRRTIDVNKNCSTGNIYYINQYNNFFQKNNNIKKKIKENINNLIRTEINKSESKIKENNNDKNLIKDNI